MSETRATKSVSKYDNFCLILVQRNKKKIFFLAVWTANGTKRDAVMEIGRKLKERLGLGKFQINYYLHADTIVKIGSAAKITYSC